MKIEDQYLFIKNKIPSFVKILVVSKNQKITSLEKLYNIGQKDFGENYTQEMIKKYHTLPKDIRWHMIGKIQSNKLKYFVPFIHLIHSVQKLKHIKMINKIGCKENRVIHCLLQIKICEEKSKSGITSHEAYEILKRSQNMKYIKFVGLMGMASMGDMKKVSQEFSYLQKIYNDYKTLYQHNVLSMGMSRDYHIAIEKGSTLIRLGNVIFNNK
ncbi:YggS family pyridoxal phosphate-dependent enzyme [Blattabacterium cuenoti]|uniref:YggS family pyridoxal phosphate-dependent enzyme n=1 Tax=Blattabacterium cuenoti TaxID=1653831 RepID=UPI00163D19C1|nr:YggS family pyridoxal phosphate-dependent enzyme [Blattabacterium cuenoti]